MTLQIGPTITEERITDWFSHCGLVERVLIRCSRGQAVATAVDHDTQQRDRLYATVEFTTSKAARRAIRLNGTVLDGCKLVVCSTLRSMDRSSTV